MTEKTYSFLSNDAQRIQDDLAHIMEQGYDTSRVIVSEAEFFHLCQDENQELFLARQLANNAEEITQGEYQQGQFKKLGRALTVVNAIAAGIITEDDEGYHYAPEKVEAYLKGPNL